MKNKFKGFTDFELMFMSWGMQVIVDDGEFTKQEDIEASDKIYAELHKEIKARGVEIYNTDPIHPWEGH